MTYAGPAPYLVAGVSQINLKMVNYVGDIYVMLPLMQTRPSRFTSPVIEAGGPWPDFGGGVDSKRIPAGIRAPMRPILAKRPLAAV